MFDCFATALIGQSLLAALPSLATLYIVCLIVGGGLLVVSTVFGGDADAGVDVDVDLDLDLDVDAEPSVAFAGDNVAHGLPLASWFSIQFVIYFAAVFGLVGTVLTFLTGLGNSGVLITATAAGIVVGQAVHQLLRWLKRTSSDGAVTTRDYLKKFARVTIAIEPPQRGEIAVAVRGRERFVSAVTQRKDDRFKVGEQVVIVAYDSGTAEVVSRNEYEFVTDQQPGGSNE